MSFVRSLPEVSSKRIGRNESLVAHRADRGEGGGPAGQFRSNGAEKTKEQKLTVWVHLDHVALLLPVGAGFVIQHLKDGDTPKS